MPSTRLFVPVTFDVDLESLALLSHESLPRVHDLWFSIASSLGFLAWGLMHLRLIRGAHLTAVYDGQFRAGVKVGVGVVKQPASMPVGGKTLSRAASSSELMISRNKSVLVDALRVTPSFDDFHENSVRAQSSTSSAILSSDWSLNRKKCIEQKSFRCIDGKLLDMVLVETYDKSVAASVPSVGSFRKQEKSAEGCAAPDILRVTTDPAVAKEWDSDGEGGDDGQAGGEEATPVSPGGDDDEDDSLLANRDAGPGNPGSGETISPASCVADA